MLPGIMPVLPVASAFLPLLVVAKFIPLRRNDTVVAAIRLTSHNAMSTLICRASTTRIALLKDLQAQPSRN